MTFNNDDELTSAISKGLKVAIEHTVVQFKKENKESIVDIVYEYPQNWYDRTHDFQDAWDHKVSGSGKHVDGEMYFEPSYISTGDQEDGKHVSVVTGASQAQNMPEILYQAGMGCIYRPTKRDAWKDLDKKLSNRRVRAIFEEGLNSSGMPWKRKTGAITVTKTQ